MFYILFYITLGGGVYLSVYLSNFAELIREL